MIIVEGETKMDGYAKKILILNETENKSGYKLKGVIKAEYSKGFATFFISVYKATCPIDEIKFYCFYGGKLLKEFYPKKMNFEITAEIANIEGLEFFAVREGEITSYAFDRKILGTEGFIKYEKTTENTGCEENPQENSNKPTNGQYTEYDDEKVATENYFELENEREGIPVENADVESENKEKEGKSENSSNAWQNAPNFGGNFYNNYYYAVKERLDKLFLEYEREENLCKTVQGGNFVKIPYDENKFYFVGYIRENGEVKYLCYGVSGKYGTLPEGMGKYCRFVPSNPYSASEEGYFLLFQYADSGETVTF